MNDDTEPATEVIPYASKHFKSIDARDIFGIIVRVSGLFIALVGLYDVVYGIIQSTGFLASQKPTMNVLAFGAVILVCGLAIMKGDWIVNFSYGQEKED